MASDDHTDAVPSFAVMTDEPYPKEIFDSGYVNNAPDEAPVVPSVTEATPDSTTSGDGSGPVVFSDAQVLNMDDLLPWFFQMRRC